MSRRGARVYARSSLPMIWHKRACALAYAVPLATLNARDFEDFGEHDGLNLIIR